MRSCELYGALGAIRQSPPVPDQSLENGWVGYREEKEKRENLYTDCIHKPKGLHILVPAHYFLDLSTTNFTTLAGNAFQHMPHG